jgi:hypothetical protein
MLLCDLLYPRLVELISRGWNDFLLVTLLVEILFLSAGDHDTGVCDQGDALPSIIY